MEEEEEEEEKKRQTAKRLPKATRGKTTRCKTSESKGFKTLQARH